MLKCNISYIVTRRYAHNYNVLKNHLRYKVYRYGSIITLPYK